MLQPIMDNASKEIKEYGMIKRFYRRQEHLNVQYLTEKINQAIVYQDEESDCCISWKGCRT